MIVEVVVASGKAKCRTCHKKITKGRYCLSSFTGQYAGIGYTHIECVFDEMTLIKCALQQKAQEE